MIIGNAMTIHVIKTILSTKKCIVGFLVEDVKVYTWYPAVTKSIHYYFGQDLVPECEAEAARRGVTFNEVAYEVRGCD